MRPTSVLHNNNLQSIYFYRWTNALELSPTTFFIKTCETALEMYIQNRMQAA